MRENHQTSSQDATTPERIVVIGGVAAGMSAASQAKRRRPDTNVVVFERGPHVSYGACGMPYNIQDPERSIDDLVVMSPERFRSERDIDVRTNSEVLNINTTRKLVRVRDAGSEREYDQAYDKLIIATGASAVKPPIPGIDLPGVFLLRELTDGRAIKLYLDETDAKRAVIVGAGYIGVEMAEALRARSLSVTVVEKLGQVIPGFESTISEVVRNELTAHGVQVETGLAVRLIEKGAGAERLTVGTDRGALDVDLVLVAVGVRPNVALARQAGIALGSTGAIAVDDGMRTNVPDVFAAGDCAEAYHLVSGSAAYIPLGTTANKQGKVAGANAAGAEQKFGGIVGTAGFKVFDLEVARTGLGQAEADRLGLDVVAAVSKHKSRGHAYPGSETLTTVLFVERASGRLLGAQMAGRGPVATRIDVFAAALHAGMSVEEIEGLDLAYAPPIAPVYDPILIAATVARKELRREHGIKDKRPERVAAVAS